MRTKTKCDPSQLYGYWAIEEKRFDAMYRAAVSADLKTLTQSDTTVEVQRHGRLAILDIDGPITKHPHSFQDLIGGTAASRVEKALKAVVEDDSFDGIVLRIDSPGGTVAGSHILAQAVAKANKKKPVYAYISDLGASAAYHVAAMTRGIRTNTAGIVGSIGTMMVVHDTSEAYAQSGVVVHKIVSGAAKGVGVDGTKISTEDLAIMQREVDSLAAVFKSDVAKGRGRSIEQVESVADGRVFVGQEAVAAGLVDAVSDEEDALEAFSLEIKKMNDPVGAFAAANPDAVKGWKDEGYKAGQAEGVKVGEKNALDRMAALTAMFPDDSAFAVRAFAAGKSAVEAKADYADVLAARMREKDAAHAKAIEEATRNAEANSGHQGVTFTGGTKQPASTFGWDSLDSMSVSDFAAKAWSENFEGCKDGPNKYQSIAGFTRMVQSEVDARARANARKVGA